MKRKTINYFDKMNVRQYLNKKAKVINKALDKYLPDKKVYPSIIHQATRYSVFAGGKRIRPILVIMTAEVLEKDEKRVLPTACAMELIHTYSLIHDDLPCMDDDDYRRGKLTSHKVFGENIAVLSGDGLLTFAFELITRNSEVNGISPKSVLQVIKIIASASGTYGMVGGQVVDILSENKEVALPVLQYIHTHKTGALIRASVQSGAVLSDAKPDEFEALTRYSENLGLIFQIVDDILNVTGNPKKLGKNVGSDTKRKKITYPTFFGVEKSREEVSRLKESAKDSLRIFKEKANILSKLVDFIAEREM